MHSFIVSSLENVCHTITKISYIEEYGGVVPSRARTLTLTIKCIVVSKKDLFLRFPSTSYLHLFPSCSLLTTRCQSQSSSCCCCCFFFCTGASTKTKKLHARGAVFSIVVVVVPHLVSSEIVFGCSKPHHSIKVSNTSQSASSSSPYYYCY